MARSTGLPAYLISLNSTPLTNGLSYYAELDNGSCFSDSRAQVNVSVGVTPQAVVVDDIFICGSTTTFNDITVNAVIITTANQLFF